MQEKRIFENIVGIGENVSNHYIGFPTMLYSQ